MIELQREGKIRHLALSNVTLAQLREGMARTPIVGVQNLYNVAAGEKRLGHLPHAAVADQEQIVDLCAATGMAFLPFFPLAIPGPGPRREAPAVAAVAKRHGKTEAQVAIAWLLAEISGDAADRGDQLTAGECAKSLTACTLAPG